MTLGVAADADAHEGVGEPGELLEQLEGVRVGASRRVGVAGDDEHVADLCTVEPLNEPLEVTAAADHARREVRDHAKATGGEGRAHVQRAVQAQRRRGGHGDGGAVRKSGDLLLDPLDGDHFVTRFLQQKGQGRLFRERGRSATAHGSPRSDKEDLFSPLYTPEWGAEAR